MTSINRLPEKDRRKIRRAYKAKDHKNRGSNPKRKDKNEYIEEDFQEDAEY